MSTELEPISTTPDCGKILVTQFGGGPYRGLCLQLTPSQQSVGNYIQLSKADARKVAARLLAWADGNETAPSKSKQSPRLLTEITIVDDRGTKTSITLYIAESMLHDYVLETVGAWRDQWGGNADHVFVRTEQRQEYEFILPDGIKRPHNKEP